MKKKGSFTVQKLCVYAGVILLLGAIITLALWQWNVYASQEKSQAYLQLLRDVMPEPQNAVPEERRDNGLCGLGRI